jgi:small subunit ribosomal protein S15
MITKAKTEEMIAKFGNGPKDTGSSAVQVAILTERITNLTTHFATNKKDQTSKRGMLKLIGQRKALLKYLRRDDPSNFTKVTKALDIRTTEAI